MAHTWKSFDFFNVSQVQIVDDEARAALVGAEVSCACAGSDSIFIGSPTGWVRVVSGGWKVAQAFQAYDDDVKITHMRQVERTSLLVTVGEDMVAEPVLKVWALDRLDGDGAPTCLSTLQVNNGKRPFPVSAFATLDDLSQVAVGFANGSVTLARGDLVNDLGTRQRIVHELEDPITGLEMATDSAGATTLLIGTTARILRLVVPKRGQHAPARTVEDMGCAVGCMVRDGRTGDVVVARDDALYTYGVETGRGAPRAYEADKKLVQVWGDYVAVVCPPVEVGGGRGGGVDALAKRRFGSAVDSLLSASTFVLLEGELRLCGHTQSLLAPVRAMLRVWGDFFVLLQDGKMLRYHEKTVQQRLELLYQRNMYPLALELAQKSGLDAEEHSAIYRRFGDHLYQKGDYDGAMTQYIRAIDSTEPSQVIRKFLDTQRIHNLIQYLEELHDRRRATADHTTLLLNCYAKLKDVGKLEAFIKQDGGELRFDLETAISMCRQGGYHAQAAYLAKRHGEIELVVDILVEDAGGYRDALAYIWAQEPKVAYKCLQKYARVLIGHCPKEATQIFVDYYTGNYRPRVEAEASINISNNGAVAAGAGTGGAMAGVGAAAAAGAGALAGAASAVRDLSSFIPLPYMPTSHDQNNHQTQTLTPPTQTQVSEIRIPYTPPPPRTAFSCFIDHPDEFIVFLEACLLEKNLPEADRTDLYTTLFEMYLYKANDTTKDTANNDGATNRSTWEAKARTLIEGEEVPMESSNVLLLSDLSNFRDGTVLVKEQAGLLLDIFRSYTQAKDTQGAMRALRKYGSREPQLYPAALAYLTSDPKILREAGEAELANVLKKIDEGRLMTPLQVVQTLGEGNGDGDGGAAVIGMIKPYLHQIIERERREIAAGRRRIGDYKAETEQMRSELAELGSRPAVFQATRCGDCRQALDLPAVHFLCKHSYHQRCLRVGPDFFGKRGEDGAAELKCPQCSARNDVIRTYRNQQAEGAARHEVFKADLGRSEDRFGTVAEWFGRGVMGG